MPADAPWSHRRRWAVLAGLAGSAGYSLAAAATTPFTGAAEAITAIPIAVAAVLAVVLWPAHPDRPAGLVEQGRPPPRHPYLGWLILLGVVVGWEVAEYLWRGSRSAHPTLSSMADAFDAHSVSKAVAFMAWLWLGAAIVWAGTPRQSRFRTPSAQPA
jgi:hypothetical protein